MEVLSTPQLFRRSVNLVVVSAVWFCQCAGVSLGLEWRHRHDVFVCIFQCALDRPKNHGFSSTIRGTNEEGERSGTLVSEILVRRKSSPTLLAFKSGYNVGKSGQLYF